MINVEWSVIKDFAREKRVNEQDLFNAVRRAVTAPQALEKQVAELARAQGGQGAELDKYQKFDQELCREVFEKLNAEFDKDPKGGITVYTEDWRASVHHLKRLPRQNIGTIGYVNTQPQPAVPEGWKLVPVEPTAAMIIAFERAPCAENYTDAATWAWEAMVDAAPQPPKEGKGDE